MTDGYDRALARQTAERHRLTVRRQCAHAAVQCRAAAADDLAGEAFPAMRRLAPTTLSHVLSPVVALDAVRRVRAAAGLADVHAAVLAADGEAALIAEARYVAALYQRKEHHDG